MVKKIKLYELKANQTDFPRNKIKTSQEAYDLIKQFYQDDIEIYESFFILLLNKGCFTVGYAKISQGGISGTIVDKKIVAKYAIDSLASGIILAHNHPSGTLQPSEQDLKLTKELEQALNLLDVNVMDHIILTKENYYSFADNGQL